MLKRNHLALVIVGGLVHLGLVTWVAARFVRTHAAFSDETSVAQELDRGLFEDLADYQAPDYPKTAASLDRCRHEADRTCLDLYDQVQGAREQLFAGGREAALARTLAVLDSQCDPSIATDDVACQGAAVALWYLDDRASDLAVRRYLAGHDAQLIGLFAASGGQPWSSNRPDGQAWVELCQRVDPADADDGVEDQEADDEDDSAAAIATQSAEEADREAIPVDAITVLADDDSDDDGVASDASEVLTVTLDNSSEVADVETEAADEVQETPAQPSWAELLDELANPQHADEKPTQD